MSPQEYGQVLWLELQERLRKAIQPRLPARTMHFDVQDVLQLCYRQLQRQEFSERSLQQAAAELPGDPRALQDHIAETVDAIAERVCDEVYVEDCAWAARFLATRNPEEQQAISDQYWLDYSDWAYGEDVDGQHPKKIWGGVLGARLTAYLGRRDAENEFGAAMDDLDALVFTVEKFGECARAYRPGLGMKFENFLKRRIRQRAGDVARDPARRRGLLEDARVDPTSLAAETAEPGDTMPSVSEAAYRECLEAFRQSHNDGRLAARKLAAFELQYKAYLDPRSEISRETLGLVAAHRPRLQDEFDACQCELRDLEEKLSAAESDCDKAWKDWQSAYRTLAAECCSPGEIVRLESKASRSNKKELEGNLAALGPAGQHSQQALKLHYQICYKLLARARGKRERTWKQWEQWEQCRLPWVRPQDTIAELLAQGSQPTVARHLAEVKQSMRVCLGLND